MTYNRRASCVRDLPSSFFDGPAPAPPDSHPSLYQLLRGRGPIADRSVEITFTGPGVEAYVFTFG